jgi:Squalene-hopene cyclase N-terminal domain
MYPAIRIGLAIVTFSVLAASVRLARSDEPAKDASPAAVVTAPQIQQAVERALGFVQKDAARWREEKKCSTCHHGTMTVFALAEAKGQGYDVPADVLADYLKWTKDRLLERIDLPRDERPGWSMVNTSALYLSLMAQTVPHQEVVSEGELGRISAHLVRHQEADGSWAWSSAPPKNRPPPFFESDEVATRLGFMALGQRVLADPDEHSPVREARTKAAAWLAKATPSDTTQAVALRLLARVQGAEPAVSLEPAIRELLSRQNTDGGWGQLKDAASDAYATGQVLYTLKLAGLASDRPEIQRGAALLVSTQREDGSWPMTPRSHPGATPAGNIVPITYFGSAWGTLGLARSFPKPPH